MQIIYAALTDRGFNRSKNEDAYLIEKRSHKFRNDAYENYLFALADGMGGHPCGEVAGKMACEGLTGFLDELFTQHPDRIEKRFKQKFFHIDSQIRRHAFINSSCMDMGTTLSAILFLRDIAVIAHVGDCRIYRLRADRLKLLTTDHSLVEEWLREGIITPKEALNHPFRNKLTQVVGTNELLEHVETRCIDIAPADRFMLSSDGLHGAVIPKEIENILSIAQSPNQAAKRLLSLALQRGGRDNITIIVVFLK